MTKEETLKYFKTWCQQTLGNNCSDKDFEMANNIMALLEQQPCEDCISRNAAIVKLSHNKIGDDDCDVIIQKDIETIKALPPVTPQQKMGHWILHQNYNSDGLGFEYFSCSECDDRNDEKSNP